MEKEVKEKVKHVPEILDKATLAKIIDTMNKQGVQITKLIRGEQRQQNEINNLRMKIMALAGKFRS